MRTHVPLSLSIAHEELRQFLVAAQHEPGRLGEEMRRVARLLAPHCQKEERFAMPPLGLLPRLARGEFHAGMAEVLTHTDWLRDNLPTLIAEHHMITAAAGELLEAARAERRVDCMEFAEKLVQHARLEEEVVYPATILIGEYLRLRLAGEGAQSLAL
jgi:hypothetical protein